MTRAGPDIPEGCRVVPVDRPIPLEPHDLTIATGDDVAFAHMLAAARPRRQAIAYLATYSAKGSMPTSARSSSTRSGSAQGHGTGAPSRTPAICVP